MKLSKFLLILSLCFVTLFSNYQVQSVEAASKHITNNSGNTVTLKIKAKDLLDKPMETARIQIYSLDEQREVYSGFVKTNGNSNITFEANDDFLMTNNYEFFELKYSLRVFGKTGEMAVQHFSVPVLSKKARFDKATMEYLSNKASNKNFKFDLKMNKVNKSNNINLTKKVPSIYSSSLQGIATETSLQSLSTTSAGSGASLIDYREFTAPTKIGEIHGSPGVNVVFTYQYQAGMKVQTGVSYDNATYKVSGSTGITKTTSTSSTDKFYLNNPSTSWGYEVLGNFLYREDTYSDSWSGAFWKEVYPVKYVIGYGKGASTSYYDGYTYTNVTNGWWGTYSIFDQYHQYSSIGMGEGKEFTTAAKLSTSLGTFNINATTDYNTKAILEVTWIPGSGKEVLMYDYDGTARVWYSTYR